MCLALARIFRSASRLPACRCRARHDPGLRCHGHDARWRSAGGRCISRAGRMRPPRRCIVRMRHACWRRKPPSYMRRASTQSHGREVRGHPPPPPAARMPPHPPRIVRAARRDGRPSSAACPRAEASRLTNLSSGRCPRHGGAGGAFPAPPHRAQPSRCSPTSDVGSSLGRHPWMW